MPGRYVESGDGYDWIEDPVVETASTNPYPLGSDEYWAYESDGIEHGAVDPVASAAAVDRANMSAFTPDSDFKTLNPLFFNDIPQSIDTSSYAPAAYTQMVGGDETGSGAYSQTTPIMRNIGGNMQGAYDPNTGKLQNIYYKDQSKGGYWDTSGSFIPYRRSGGGGLGGFLSGMFSGFKDLATSDAVKTLAPMIISGGLGGAAGVGGALGIGSTAGGALVGAGTAALTGGDVLKGALMGGIGGAGGAQIGDTGVSVGQVGAGLNVAKNLESGNLLGAITGAANLSGANSMQIGDTGFTIGDLAKNANLAKSIADGNPQALFAALTSVSKYAGGPSSSDMIEGYFAPGGEGYIAPTEEGPLTMEGMTPEEVSAIDWASLYAEPTTNPVTGETIVGGDLSQYPNQDFGDSAADYLANGQINVGPGGFTSGWQTSGSDRIMLQDDGTGIGINENGESYALTPEQVTTMIDNGQLNTKESGYVDATGGTGNTPGGSGAAATPRAPTAPVAPAPAAPAAPVKTVAPVAAPATQVAQGYMPGVGDVAHIKSLESLFGPILGTLPAEPDKDIQDDSLSALEGMDQDYASGGHVDDFSVEALLHILRS
jgi:hypothetical protein